MKPLQTTNELIQFAESELSKEYTSIARAFHTGHVENLGAFRCITDSPGWILKIKSKFGNTYYIAIVMYRLNYHVDVLNEPPWEYWEGDKSDNKMYKGDNPEVYKLLRNKEIRDAENKSNKTTV